MANQFPVFIWVFCRLIAGLLQATLWFLFGIFVHCEMQQSWAKKTLKNFHRIYSIHFYIQQQPSVIFFYHDNLTKSIYYSLAHFKSAHDMIPYKVPLKFLRWAVFTKYNLIFVLVWTIFFKVLWPFQKSWTLLFITILSIILAQICYHKLIHIFSFYR